MNLITIDNPVEFDFRWNPEKRRPMLARRALLIRLFRSASRFQQKLAQWQAIREFESLDDQHLQDIGIERYEIRDFVLHGKG